jgi:predicted dinucleotide-binding enzyme
VHVVIVGTGAVGARTARQLLSTPEVTSVGLRGGEPSRVRAVAASLGDGAEVLDPAARLEADAVVIASPAGTHLEVAREALAAGIGVVSTTDSVEDVRALLQLDIEARERGVAVVVGAGLSPGLTCLLAAHAAARFDEVHEVHVAKVGTGGPACARLHHKALGGPAVDWRDGWVERPGGSGRELCWFPDPLAAQDCYRAALPEALLLVPALPGVHRVTARVAATRRDRLTARLPMLWPTHPEGGPGAVRVEVRGARDGGRDVEVLGAMDRPAVAAGAVAAVAALFARRGALRRPGAGGLAELAEPIPFLTELARRGVRAATFEGNRVRV